MMEKKSSTIAKLYDMMKGMDVVVDPRVGKYRYMRDESDDEEEVNKVRLMTYGISSGRFSEAMPILKINTANLCNLKLAFPVDANSASKVLAAGTAASSQPECYGDHEFKGARPSPFGLGSKTVYDQAIRKSWELQPSQVELNTFWVDAVQRCVDEDVLLDLDLLHLKGHVRAELNKLLIYEKGDHFAPHRDSEKAPGMFGTLVVTLPSDYEGGDFVVHQQTGSKFRYDFGGQERRQMHAHYLALYADMLHEVEEVTAGYRVTLVYNLICDTPDCLPTRLADEQVKTQLESAAILLRKWSAEVDATKSDCRMLFELQHMYSMSSIRAGHFKGKDARAADFWRAIAEYVPELDLEVALVMMERVYKGTTDGYETYDEVHKVDANAVATLFAGRVEPTQDFGRSLYEDVSRHKKKVVYDEGYSSTMPSLKKIHIQFPDNWWENYLNDERPSQKEEEGPMGNEGSDFTQWYRKCALVISTSGARSASASNKKL